jgi:RNA polymerase sigma-70 factor (ECF subfamily)
MPQIPLTEEPVGRPARPPSTRFRESALNFDAVYDQHFDLVWRSLRRLGVPPSSIDDVTQEVFIVVYRRLADYDGRASVKSWLFGIAYLSYLSHARRERRKGGHLPLSPAVPSLEPSPFDHASRTEAARFIEAFLATLDDAKRAVFILAELERMTAPEIAQALGVKLNTVYSRLRAARAALHDAVAAQMRGEP